MKKKLIKISVALAMAVWAVIALVVVTSGKTGSSVQPAVFPPVHPDIFFDARYFGGEGAVQAAQSGTHLRGAVVPHHQLAGKLTGEVFAMLQAAKPETVIIIGPNHLNRGAGVITSAIGWSTPFGTVSPDLGMIKKILAAGLAVVDDPVCGSENSVGSLMPYVKYYLPKARVVPIILNHNLGLSEAKGIGASLAGLSDGKAVILASVDFSHYLPVGQAAKKDQETLAALQQGNLGAIFQMGDDHLDSPPSLGAFFGSMDALGSPGFQVLGHSSSAEILGNKLIQTTSYFTLIFPEKSQI